MATRKPKAVTSTRTTAAASPAKTVEPEVVKTESPKVADPELRKKELIDTVVAMSGVKKRDAKPVIEAMLSVLGETIAEGRELNLAPLGKLKITRMKKTTKAQVITARLRRNDRSQAKPDDALAQAAE